MTVQLGVAPIISTKTLSKNNSRSLRGVAISSSLLHFGMFAHSTTLISRFSHFKHHRCIYWVYHLLGIPRFTAPRPLGSQR